MVGVRHCRCPRGPRSAADSDGLGPLSGKVVRPRGADLTGARRKRGGGASARTALASRSMSCRCDGLTVNWAEQRARPASPSCSVAPGRSARRPVASGLIAVPIAFLTLPEGPFPPPGNHSPEFPAWPRGHTVQAAVSWVCHSPPTGDGSTSWSPSGPAGVVPCRKARLRRIQSASLLRLLQAGNCTCACPPAL